MGQHSETVSVGRKGTSVISFQCCRLQCPAPFTTENTALFPYPGLPLLFPVQLVPSTLLLAGRLQTPQPLLGSLSFTQEQFLKCGWLDSVS